MTADFVARLSAAQMEIWLAQALMPESAIYNVGETLQLPASLDVEAFKAALNIAVSETDALHVRFSRTDRGPLQHTGISPRWRILEDPEPAKVGTDLDRRLQRELETPIDLEGDALFRTTLFRLDVGGFVWCQLFHHIVMDGFGRHLFMRRVAELYNQIAGGLPLSDRAFGAFDDLLADDRAYHESDEAHRDRGLWRRELSGFKGTASRTAAGGSMAGFRRQAVRLSPEDTKALHDFSAVSGVGIASILSAAAAAVSARTAASDETVVGFVASARTKAARSIPGAISNVLPLRLSLDLRESWRDLLGRVRERVQFALDHQRTRLEDMRRDLGPSGDGAELTPVVVNVIPFFEPLQFGGEAATPRNLSNGPVDDFSVVAYPHRSEDCLRIDFNAHAGRRDDEDLTTFRKRFLRFLSGIVSDADASIGSVDLLFGDERSLVLDRWNATAAPVPPVTPA
ncbi:MAG: condensation domain-containing protein, partial [Beijerinckiaceae bacterium]|nr:condensation domain-containing protein [Beijerinckiaceae bacterium]